MLKGIGDSHKRLERVNRHHDGLFPEGFVVCLLRAIGIGQAYAEWHCRTVFFARKHFWEQTNRKLWRRFEEEIPRDCRQQLNAVNRTATTGPSLWQALQACFWFGAYSTALRSFGETGTDPRIRGWGSRCIREFTAALLWLPYERRCDLLRLSNSLERDDGQRLRQLLCGAAGTSYATHGFIQHGVDVYLPSVEDDVEDKIDLLAWDSRQRHGYCLQIKTRSSNNASFLKQAVHEALSWNSGRLLEEGTARIEREYGGSWSPLALKVGLTRDELGTPIGVTVTNLIEGLLFRHGTLVAADVRIAI